MSYLVEYENGVFDCMSGVGHKSGMGDHYDNGYSSQYAIEQKRTHESE